MKYLIVLLFIAVAANAQTVKPKSKASRAPTVIAAPLQPFSIKGLTLGMDRNAAEDVITTLPGVHRKNEVLYYSRESGWDNVFPSGLDTLVGVPVQSVALHFFDNKLDSVYIKISETRRATDIAEAFTEKFGKPTVATAEVKNILGYVGKQYIWTWEQKDASLTIISPSDKIDETSITLSSSASKQRFLDKKNKDKKDL